MRKLFTYFFVTIWALVIWLLVAVVIGIIVIYIFPSNGQHTPLKIGLVWRQANGVNAVVGVGLDWRNLPGTILGFLAAWQSWRTHASPKTKTLKT